MAALLKMEEWAFIQEFTRLRPQRDGLALKDKEDGACIFLDGRDCRVQDAKPHQCKGFPNAWNFPGWRATCEAVPVLTRRVDSKASPEVPRLKEDHLQ